MKQLVYICLFIIVSTPCHADELKVGLNQWPPFVYSESEPYRGISVDVVKELSNRLGVKTKMEDYPWKRMLYSLEEGTIDCAAFVAKNKEREQYILYPSTPYYAVSTVFYVQKGKKDLIQKYEDLYKITVGTVVDSEYFDPFNKDTRINKHVAYKEILLLRLLEAGRVDAIVGSYPQIYSDIVRNGYSEKFEQAAYRPGNEVDLYTGFSRKSAFCSKIEQISQIILHMKKEGQIDEIVNRYLK